MKCEVRGHAPIGAVLLLDTQEYRLSAYKPHERADGSITHLLVWTSRCPTCGEAFDAETAGLGRAPARRCAPCRKLMGTTKIKGGGAVVAILTLAGAGNHGDNERD